MLEKENIKMDVIVGNHDVTYKNTNEINAMHELFDRYDNINVFIDPVERTYDGLPIALVPNQSLAKHLLLPTLCLQSIHR